MLSYATKILRGSCKQIHYPQVFMIYTTHIRLTRLRLLEFLAKVPLESKVTLQLCQTTRGDHSAKLLVLLNEKATLCHQLFPSVAVEGEPFTSHLGVVTLPNLQTQKNGKQNKTKTKKLKIWNLALYDTLGHFISTLGRQQHFSIDPSLYTGRASPPWWT